MEEVLVATLIRGATGLLLFGVNGEYKPVTNIEVDNSPTGNHSVVFETEDGKCHQMSYFAKATKE